MAEDAHKPYEVTIDGNLFHVADRAGVQDLLSPYRRHPDQHMVDIVYRPLGGSARTPKWADISQGGDFWWEL